MIAFANVSAIRDPDTRLDGERQILPGKQVIGELLGRCARRKQLGVVVRWQATLALAASAVMAAAALLVATPWRVPLALTALSLASLVLHGSVAAFLSGLQAFRRQALLGVATLALQIALFALVVLVDGGVAGFVLAHAVANAAGLAAVAAVARSHGRAAGALPASPLTSPARAEMLRYARSVSALVVLDAVVWQRTEVAFLQWMSSPAEVSR